MTCNIGKKKFLNSGKYLTIRSLGFYWGCSECAGSASHENHFYRTMILWRGIEVADGLILSSDLSVSDPSGMFVCRVFFGGQTTKGS